jgi:peptidoglycan/LPS O-acetylase OafA/YrhL
MSSAARPASSGGRFAFLDTLRGIAVLLVLLQHVGEHALPGVRSFSAQHAQIGQMGVMIFFCCSGFIIPVSLERTGALRPFWINRAHRLYPLYWFSLAVAFVAVVMNRYPDAKHLTGLDWVANTTMFQMYLGRPNAVGLYWSLAWEMAFYIGISVLFVLMLHRRSVFWSLVTSAGLALAAIAVPALVPSVRLPMGLFIFAAMLMGTVYYRWLSGSVTGATLAFVVLIAATAAVVVLCRNLHGHPDLEGLGARSLIPMIGAWLGALGVFGAITVAGKYGFSGPWTLRQIGTISYSIYLLQGLVLGIVTFGRHTPGWLQALAWTAMTIALSVLTYRWVERPAIARGHRLAKKHLPHKPETISNPASLAAS